MSSMPSFLAFYLAAVLVWCVGVLIAWSLNHKDIKNFYGEAPFNWRIFGYRLTYIPYLEKRKLRREQNEQG